MRIAFAHNLQRHDNEDEAEFDTKDTVEAITASLHRLGHEVTPVEVAGPVSHLVARLEALSPDLVFNTAEGRVGRCREAFYPALFEQLGLRYTGSDPFVCTITLDKRLSKTLVAERGVPVVPGFLYEHARDPVPDDLLYPVIVKPNAEGSSKGITEDSVLPDRATLKRKLPKLLAQYPGGLLVESFIRGQDVVIPFLEGASPETGGMLAVAQYRIAESVQAKRKYVMYDYALKHDESDAVEVRVPAELPDALTAAILDHCRRANVALGMRDLGRFDFRIDEDGDPWFIEANALPSLEPGASIYESARLTGFADMDAVLSRVIESAMSRPAPAGEAPVPHTRPIRVGLVYNLKRAKPTADGPSWKSTVDQDAEYDSPDTVKALSEAIESFGHEVEPIEANADLLGLIRGADLDVVFNIAEGIRGRGREALVPAILELLDLAYTGSDPATLAVTLDKAFAKRVVHEAGIPTPAFVVMRTGKEPLPRDFTFPAIVKPVAEGSSKGVMGTSVVRDEAALRAAAREMSGRYGQGALAEVFLPGREFTVGLLGARPRVLAPMEIVFEKPPEELPIYTFGHKIETETDVRFEVPAQVPQTLDRALRRTAREAFRALGCRDVARIDLRLDAAGRVHFIECNPLPGLSPGFSDLCVIAEAEGIDYRSLVGEILRPALRRRRALLRARRRQEASR